MHHKYSGSKDRMLRYEYVGRNDSQYHQYRPLHLDGVDHLYLIHQLFRRIHIHPQSDQSLKEFFHERERK